MTSTILDRIIKQNYRDQLYDWDNYATKQQLLGLQCIHQIYQTKGNQPINITLPSSKTFYQTHQSLMSRKFNNTSKELAQQHFRTKQLTTSYQFYHNGNSQPKKIHANIFEFKTLSKLDLSRPLTSLTINFIDNWLTIKDKKQYQQAILACLRSLNSKLALSDPKSTEMKSQYKGKIDWSLSKPVRVDKAGEQLFGFKPNLNAIRRQQQKQQKLRQKLKQLQKTQFAKQLTIYKHFKIN